MSRWQFWLLFGALIAINGQLVAIHSSMTGENTSLWRQVHWITWKLDQRGDEKIRVLTEPGQ